MQRKERSVSVLQFHRGAVSGLPTAALPLRAGEADLWRLTVVPARVLPPARHCCGPVNDKAGA